jgi:hypothetical protein
MTTRREHDLLGDRDVPADAYYGVHTLRAIENFPITGTRISIYPDLIAALASIKSAAARSNHELGLLDATRTDAIVAAAEEIRAGKLDLEVKPDEFRDRGVHVARIPEDDLGHHLLEHGPLFRNIMAGARPSAVVSNVHGLVGCREPRRRGSGLQGSPSGGVLCALLLYDAYQRVYASKSPQEYAEAAFDAQQVAHHLGLAPVSV